MTKRTDKLNSLLKQVISDVIRKDVGDPNVHSLVTVTRVDVTKDLRHAKVYISVIGTKEEKSKTLEALKTAAGFIAVKASKQVVLHFFPELLFKLDEGIDNQIRVQELLHKIEEEKATREHEQQE